MNTLIQEVVEIIPLTISARFSLIVASLNFLSKDIYMCRPIKNALITKRSTKSIFVLNTKLRRSTSGPYPYAMIPPVTIIPNNPRLTSRCAHRKTVLDNVSFLPRTQSSPLKSAKRITKIVKVRIVR